MPEVTNPDTKTVEATLDQVSYPSSVDIGAVRDDRDFEGTENSLPPSATNPVFGADGALPMTEIIKTK